MKYDEKGETVLDEIKMLLKEIRDLLKQDDLNVKE